MNAPIPDFCMPLVGWRVWSITDDGMLRALYNTYIWPVKRAASSAIRPEMKPYELRFSSHGIYAMKKPIKDDPHVWLAKYDHYECYAFGFVYLWGTVIEHKHGYRAQYGYPKEVYASHSWKEIEAHYGIPCYPANPYSRLLYRIRNWRWQNNTRLAHEAEAADSKSAQDGFDSRTGYQI